MNLELFIAKRIFKGKDNANSLSKPIVNIAVGGIAIGIAVMIISVAIVTGFQREITSKVAGFSAHVKVVSLNDDSEAYNKLVIDYALLEKLNAIPGVKSTHPFSQQSGILEVDNEIQGVIIKGVDSLFLPENFTRHLQEGRFPKDGSDENEVLASTSMAQKLAFKIGDKVRLFFVNNGKPASPKLFKVVGLYKTGLPTYDTKLVFVNLSDLQKVKAYGINAYLKVDSLSVNHKEITALAFGGDKSYRYNWSNNFVGPGPHLINNVDTSAIQVVVEDNSKTISDTANYYPVLNLTSTSNGSNKYYADGYEVFISDLNKLEAVESKIYDRIDFNLTTINLKEENGEIFNWLEILDVNVYIIIILLAVVAIINMCSALLILILERSNMIGILKAMGATNYSLRKIFLYNGVLLIAKGLFWGNGVAILLLLIQHFTGIISLPEEQYYVSAVPVNFSFMVLGVLNLLTIFVGAIVLFLPAMLIAQLSPVKTIKYD